MEELRTMNAYAYACMEAYVSGRFVSSVAAAPLYFFLCGNLFVFFYSRCIRCTRCDRLVSTGLDRDLMKEKIRKESVTCLLKLGL